MSSIAEQIPGLATYPHQQHHFHHHQQQQQQQQGGGGVSAATVTALRIRKQKPLEPEGKTQSQSATPASTSTSVRRRGSSVSFPRPRSLIGPQQRPQHVDDNENEADEVLTNAEPPPPEKITKPKTHVARPLNHVFAVHQHLHTSVLTREDERPGASPPLVGFRNLAALIFLFSNVEHLVENYEKYTSFILSPLIQIPWEDYRQALFLTAQIPVHFFVSLLIEKVAAYIATDKGLSTLRRQRWLRSWWVVIAVLHSLNALFCLAHSCIIVYTRIFHPLVGTFCSLHAVVVALKLASYALTNRDLREAYMSGLPVPETYKSCPYPKNLSLNNLVYFWWAPTLVYQPVYPRTASIRWPFVAKRVAEIVGLSLMVLLLVIQYAIPLTRQCLVFFEEPQGHLTALVIRFSKLATISIIAWLCGFFALFQSGLNLLAELTRFGDRNFYGVWWNSASVATFWRLWNRPVSNYLRRHVYSPLLSRGMDRKTASTAVFFVSAVLHELVAGVATHNFIGAAFFSMLVQVPLVALTVPLEKARGSHSILGNCVFWLSLIFGLPLDFLLYYYYWDLKHGSQQTAS